MAKLKRTILHAAASRKPVIPGLGLPIGVTIGLLACVMLTMTLFRGWRAWLVIFVVVGLIGFLIRVLVQRDGNALRVHGLWLRTKAFFLDAKKWRGVTLRSFPHRRDISLPRGIPAR